MSLKASRADRDAAVSAGGDKMCSNYTEETIHNEYSGWTVPLDKTASLPRIRFRSHLTSKDFFDEYVRHRRPVILTDPEGPDDSWKGSQWDIPYLRNISEDRSTHDCKRKSCSEEQGGGCIAKGNVICQSSAESRKRKQDQDESSEAPAKKIPNENSSNQSTTSATSAMQSKQSSTNLERKDGLKNLSSELSAKQVYLTTQDLGQDFEGRPLLHSAPCTQLLERGDFPLRPLLLNKLIPMNYNLWMGSTSDSTTPSSSGLHHDFHDNLYILLRGRKTFRLFSPADASCMYTVGRIRHIYPNGRICYEEPFPEADGSDAQSRLAMEAEICREAAEEAIASAEAALATGKPGAAKALELAEDQLEEALIRAMNVERDSEHDTWDSADGDDEENETNHYVDKDNTADRLKSATADNVAQEIHHSTETPAHFSRIDLCKSKQEIIDEFPRFKHAHCLTITLEAGEMLYLPAGWFHEVRSDSSLIDGYHMAFNYWFHPPDGQSYDTPYTSPFWNWDWQKRKQN